MQQLRRVLNAKAMRDEARRKTLLAIFGAEGEEEEDEEEDESPDDSDDSEDSEDEEESSEPETFPRSYVEKLRKEAAASRTKAAEAQKQLDAINEKDLSEKELAEKRATEAEARADEAESRIVRLLRSSRIESVARELTFNDPDDAHALIADQELETDDEGIPTSKAVRKALRKLVEEKPYLVGGTSADGGAQGQNPKTNRQSDRVKELTARGDRVVIG